jgi:drug/metabolite transporter (DMT)-like permease
MITSPIRTACALSAAAAFFVAIAAIVTDGEWALPLVAAAVFALVAMVGAGPAPRDFGVILENFRRFRVAMMVCFTTAITLYSLAAAMKNQAAATLGVAFWLVAFVLAFFVVYFRSRVRVFERAQ